MASCGSAGAICKICFLVVTAPTILTIAAATFPINLNQSDEHDERCKRNGPDVRIIIRMLRTAGTEVYPAPVALRLTHFP